MMDEKSSEDLPIVGCDGAVDDLLKGLSAENGTSLGIALLVQYGDWEQLRAIDVAARADEFPDVKAFAVAYQAAELLRKDVTRGAVSDSDRIEATLAKWRATEEACRATNRRFRPAEMPQGIQSSSVWDRFLRIVSETLDGHGTQEEVVDRFLHGGDSSSSVLEECIQRGSFGPGAMVGFPGQDSTLSQKYTCPLTVTEKLMPFVEHMMPEGWRAMRSHTDGVLVDGNEWFSVPKNAVINRACAAEPAWNVWLQLGIGRVMRQCMKRRLGVDLSNQKFVNRALVEHAYAWDLVTIDLSSASDLLASSMLCWALPGHWFHLLDIARSETTTLPGGEVVRLEKFCSMGNGFTFPLQTLIFTALVRAIVPHDEHCLTAVFGDDIIVPRRYAADVIDGLEFLGLQVNRTKTHLAGGFRESCGVDVFRGVNVRPTYRRIEHQTDPVRWANALYRWNCRIENLSRFERVESCLCTARAVWQTAVGEVPIEFRLPGPERLGDAVVNVPTSVGAFFCGLSTADISVLPWIQPWCNKDVSIVFTGDKELNAPLVQSGNQLPRTARRLLDISSTWESCVVMRVIRRASQERDRKSIGLIALDLHKREIPHLYEQQDGTLPQADSRLTRGYEPIRGSLQRISEEWAIVWWPGLA